MARRCFFSFHYERDVWRAGQVRNSWVAKPDREAAGFWDAASWESVKRRGEDAVNRWIRDQLNGTSVTIVLIGAETADRKYVRYEIQESWDRGNGLIGIYIHNMKDQNGKTDRSGRDPFVAMGFKNIRTYDWVSDNGYDNIGDWVEAAYQRAQQRKAAQPEGHDTNGDEKVSHQDWYAVGLLVLVIAFLAWVFPKGGADSS